MSILDTFLNISTFYFHFKSFHDFPSVSWNSLKTPVQAAFVCRDQTMLDYKTVRTFLVLGLNYQAFGISRKMFFIMAFSYLQHESPENQNRFWLRFMMKCCRCTKNVTQTLALNTFRGYLNKPY